MEELAVILAAVVNLAAVIGIVAIKKFDIIERLFGNKRHTQSHHKEAHL